MHILRGPLAIPRKSASKSAGELPSFTHQKNSSCPNDQPLLVRQSGSSARWALSIVFSASIRNDWRFTSPPKDFEFRMSTRLGMDRLRAFVGWRWKEFSRHWARTRENSQFRSLSGSKLKHRGERPGLLHTAMILRLASTNDATNNGQNCSAQLTRRSGRFVAKHLALMG